MPLQNNQHAHTTMMSLQCAWQHTKEHACQPLQHLPEVYRPHLVRRGSAGWQREGAQAASDYLCQPHPQIPDFVCKQRQSAKHGASLSTTMQDISSSAGHTRFCSTGYAPIECQTTPDAAGKYVHDSRDHRDSSLAGMRLHI